MKKNLFLGQGLILGLLLLFIAGCGNTVKNVTDKVVDTQVNYVYDYPLLRTDLRFENNITEPASNLQTLLLLSLNETSGPIAYDKSTNANHGNILGATFNSSGKFNNCLNFTAANQRITVTNNASLSNYDDLEISLWINPTAISATYKTLVAKWETSGQFEYRFALYNSQLYFYTSYNGVNEVAYTSFTDKVITANKWNHVAVRITDNYLTFYVNGAPAGRFFMSSGIRKGTSNIHIGQRVTGGTPADQYAGYMDEVKLSNGTQEDIEMIGIRDYSTNENNGSNFSQTNGTNTLDSTKSIVFNGTSDYVCIGSHPSLDLNKFTLEADVNPNGVAANQYLICKGAGTTTAKYNYYLRLNANRPTIGFQDVQGTIYELSSPTTIINSKWTKLAGVYDGEKLLIYIDGVKNAELLVKNGTATIVPANNDCPLMLGRQDYTAVYYKGELDNVKISAEAKIF